MAYNAVARWGLGRRSPLLARSTSISVRSFARTVNRGGISDTAERSINRWIKELEVSPTLEINTRTREMKHRGERVYGFGFGQSPFPVHYSVVEALKTHAHQKDYLPVRGLPALQEVVANDLLESTGVEYKPSNIAIMPGSKQGLFNLFLATDCDLVLPQPSWVSYAPQGKILSRTVGVTQTTFEDKWFVNPQRLDEELTQQPSRPNSVRIMVLNSPNNPTGLIMAEERLKELASVARKHNLIVLSDEIYGHLAFDQSDYQSIAKHYPEGTIVSSGLSKWCGAGGWRMGYLAVPSSLEGLLPALDTIASETFSAVSAPIQNAAVTAYAKRSDRRDLSDSDGINAYLRQQRAILRAVGRFCASEMREAGAKVHDPEGGFYTFPLFQQCPTLSSHGVTSSRALCNVLLRETGVAFLPGSAFLRDASELSARMAFVPFDGERALNALKGKADDDSLDKEINGEFLRQYCPEVVEGMAALKRFLTC